MYSLSFLLNSLIFLPSSIKPIFLYKAIALSFVENTPRETFSINGLSLAHSNMLFINDFPIPLPLKSFCIIIPNEPVCESLILPGDRNTSQPTISFCVSATNIVSLSFCRILFIQSRCCSTVLKNSLESVVKKSSSAITSSCICKILAASSNSAVLILISSFTNLYTPLLSHKLRKNGKIIVLQTGPILAQRCTIIAPDYLILSALFQINNKPYNLNN